MSVLTKRFIIYGIFNLSAIAWLVSVVPFMLGRAGEISVFARVSAFVVFIAGILFLRIAARLSVKRFNLNNAENQWQMSQPSKMFLTVAICEVGGLTALVLWFWAVTWLVDVSGKFPNTLGMFCVVLCSFTIWVAEELELFHIFPNVLAISIAFFIQFIIYGIIGLLFYFYVFGRVKHAVSSCDSKQ